MMQKHLTKHFGGLAPTQEKIWNKMMRFGGFKLILYVW